MSFSLRRHKNHLILGRIGNSVAKAIEMTKRRQAFDNVASTSDENSAPSPVITTSGSKPKSNPRPTRIEKLDVSRLNQLLKTIDKTWIMPRTGSREPVGSNFQVKQKYLILMNFQCFKLIGLKIDKYLSCFKLLFNS